MHRQFARRLHALQRSDRPRPIARCIPIAPGVEEVRLPLPLGGTLVRRYVDEEIAHAEADAPSQAVVPD